MPPDPTEADIATFVSASIPSVWALETLLLLKGSGAAGRDLDSLVSDLRSSELAVTQGLKRLQQAGLITSGEDIFRYSPASPALARLADAVERIYAAKPVWLVKLILTSSNENLQLFADAFRLKD